MRHAPLIAGRYEPLRLLGSGGMGNVYLADDRLLARQVALKLLKKHLAEDPDALARFRKEALAAASLSHPNIVRVFDAGEDELGGVPYIAMEHVPGGTLAHLLAREGRLRPGEAARIAAKIALALNEAHAKGIVHRDVKPQNVLLDEGGEPKVTDFGIALAASSASTALTRTAMIVGTARYLSPEQAQGDVATEKSDLYSLGIVLYEMLTGRVPFDADNPVALALKHVTEHPPRPRELAPRVAPALEAATLGLLSKRPADRPRNAAVASRMLSEAAARAEASPAESEPTTRIAPPRDRRNLARRRRRGLAVAGVLCAGLLAIPAALAQPAFLRDAYSGWFGEDPRPVDRIVPSTENASGRLEAPAPAEQVPQPPDPTPRSVPDQADEEPPAPEPEPRADASPPDPDARQAPQYAANDAPAPIRSAPTVPPPTEAPEPRPAPQAASPEPPSQAPPAAQPTEPPAPRPDPSPPEPRPAPDPPPAPAAPPVTAEPAAAPQPAAPQPAPPSPRPREDPPPRSSRVDPRAPAPAVDPPDPQTFPVQEDEESAGRRR